MIQRLIHPPTNHSFFLFGPRQTGKSTLLRACFTPQQTLSYDLLQSDEYVRLAVDPSLFRQEVLARAPRITHVVVDEVQRIPALLDEIHSLLERSHPPIFCLSGSSARKLKKAPANLLAGRAWTYHLYPLTHWELGDRFSLDKALNLGTLPSVYLNEHLEGAHQTLRAYVETYLKEEVQQEALTRNVGGFLRFLTLAGDENGHIINYSNIARETGVSYHTIKEYFHILEDTLIGVFLLPYARTVRTRLVKHPKFYFFDTGVHRALTKKLSVGLEKRTSDYGRAFEHFLILELMRLASYQKLDYDFSFYHSAAHAEVDLIIVTPRGKTYAIEIKATDTPHEATLGGLKSFAEVCPKAELLCACLAQRKRVVEEIRILPWRDVFAAVGITPTAS
jgi:predicted AAA+ superfamily ATPase